MKLVYLVIVLALWATAATAPVAAESNMTPVSVFQNATVYVNTTSGLARIGSFDNASVYVDGGANATVVGASLAVDLGAAPGMGYRDVYLFYRLPAGFANVTFDCDLQAGEKSNVLLFDFSDELPGAGLRKGGMPDRSIAGFGTWTAMYSEIGGLKAFPEGRHRIELFPAGDMLFVKVDGNITAFGGLPQRKYLVIHLMTGDGDSYLRGTLSNLRYAGPELDAGGGDGDGNRTPSRPPGFPLPAGNGSGNGGPVTPFPSASPDPATEHGTARPGGINLWFALAVGVALAAGWAFVYFKYLNK
jgi:hypothetical protein